MLKRTKAARSILNSTKNIKDLAVSSMSAITKYIKPGEDQGYIEDARDEFIFEKKLSEFADFKVTNSLSDLQVSTAVEK